MKGERFSRPEAEKADMKTEWKAQEDQRGAEDQTGAESQARVL